MSSALHRHGLLGQLRHPHVTILRVTDLSPEEFEQIARSLAMSRHLGDRDRRDVIDARRRLAAIEKSKRRRPAGGP